LQSVVVDRRNPAVRIDREIFRRSSAAVAEMDRDVLVVEPELVDHPQHAIGARAGNAVNLQIAHGMPRRRLRSVRNDIGKTSPWLRRNALVRACTLAAHSRAVYPAFKPKRITCSPTEAYHEARGHRGRDHRLGPAQARQSGRADLDLRADRVDA